MRRSQSEQRHRLAGWDERIRNDALIKQGQAGDRVTVDEGDDDLSGELGRAVELGEPAHNVGFGCAGQPQLDRRVCCDGHGVPGFYS
jgi:hypothetical protein